MSSVDLIGKYRWVISNANIDAAKELGLTGIKKYWRYAGQVEMELDWLHNWILAVATFVRHSHKVYNNEEVTKNMNARQDIDPKWVSSFFVQLHEPIQYWKIDGKNISDVAKWVKKYV